MRELILRKIAYNAYRRPWYILAAALVVTIIALLLSRNLELSLRWSDLMPESDPRAIEFNRVLEKYQSASSIMILVRGDEQKIKAFADEAKEPISQVTSTFDDAEAPEALIKRVLIKEDADFAIDHGLMLTKKKDLENSKDFFSDFSLVPLMTHINDNLEKTYIYSDDEERLSNREKSDKAVRYLDGLKYWLESMEDFAEGEKTDQVAAVDAAQKLMIGDLHFLSYDHRSLMILAYPTFPVTDSERGNVAADSIEAILNRINVSYPDVEFGMTGMIVMGRDELRAVQSDMNYLTLVALVLIFALFVVSFRMWLAPLFAVLVLVIAVIWTMAFTALTVGSLNIMTAMFGVILVGLGIDFSIHILSGFAEHRGHGDSIHESVEATLLKAGPGVITGGMTTGIAFLTLMISDSKGMYEMGLVTGFGILICMVAAMTLLPPFLVLRERRRVKRSKQSLYHPVEFRFLGSMAEGLARVRWITLVILIGATGLLTHQAFQIKFDYDMLELEPKGMPSVVTYDSLMAAFDMSPDYALITSSSLDSIRMIAERAKDFPNIAWVDAITEYLPTAEEQEERSAIIDEIKTDLSRYTKPRRITAEDYDVLLEELDRLWMNVVEMSDLAFQSGQDRLEQKAYELVSNPDIEGSPDYIQSLIAKLQDIKGSGIEKLNGFQASYFDFAHAIALRMTNTEPITLESLPETIVERYQSDDGTTYLVSLYPENDIWNMENLDAFNRQLMSISPRATGTPPLFQAMIEIVGKDGKNATIIAFFTILLLLYLDFRKISLALLAAVPLLTGAFWMVGFHELLGLSLNLNNINAIPLILGIGIDDGVHLIHRYRIEGKGMTKLIFTSTGKAVLLTTLTTMIGFGSLAFMSHRGMASMGLFLVIGVVACFLTSVGFLAPIFGARKKKA